jgi:predicted TIM-barrel enzyme
MEVLYGSGVDSNNINEILNVCDGVGIGKNSINIYTLKEIFDKIN